MTRARRLPLILGALVCLLLPAPSAVAQERKDPRRLIAAEVETILTAPHADRSRTTWAGRVLAGLRFDRTDEIARRAVAEGPWPARQAVAEALPFLPEPLRITLLVQLTRDHNWAVRATALRGLAHRPSPDGLAAALAAASDPVWSVRWQAIRTLAAYPGSTLPPAERRQRFAALVAARKDSDAEVRAEAERVLLVSREPEAVPVYLEIFDRESAREEIEAGRGVIAARALLAVGDETVRAALRRRLAAAARRTRILAARILQLRGEDPTGLVTAWGDRFAADLLAAWCAAPGPERAAAEGLAHALGRRAARAALPRFAAGDGAGAREEIAAWLVATLGYGAPESGPEAAQMAADPGRLVAALQATTTTARARQALVRALPTLGPWAPRAWLEAKYRAAAARAAARKARNLADADAGYRVDLFTALRGTVPFDGWPAVLEIALEDRSVHVRGLAALAWITTSGDPKPYERIARALAVKRSDHFGRQFLRQVARRRDEPTFAFLLAAAQGTFSNKAKLRLAAVNALTSVTWSKAKRQRLVGWLARRLRSERDADARIRMVMLLGNLDPAAALDVLAPIALDQRENPNVRVQTINKLGGSRLPAAAAALRVLLARPDPEPSDEAATRVNARLKAAAYRALFALALQPDVPLMLKVVAVGPERTRRTALGALLKLRDPAARTVVEAMTRNGLVEIDNRARGLKVLAAIGGPEVSDELFKRLREETHPEMRLGALEALALRDPDSYVARLIHYLSALRDGRRHQQRSRELFDEILGELGKVPAPAVTRFLIDMLLEHALRTDSPARRGRRPDPLQIAARAALAGHGSKHVTLIFDTTLDRLAAAGRGLGIRKTFYHDLVRFLSHPARRLAWSSLTADLTRRARKTPPIGTRDDAAAAVAVADLTFESGHFREAMSAYLTAHLLAVREGSVDREAAAAALTDDPVARPLALSTIALGMDTANTQPEMGDRFIRNAVKLVPYDTHVLLSAVQALARLGRDLDLAITCLETLGARSRDQAGALARTDLGFALLAAGRKPDALRQLAIAVRDYQLLRDELARDSRVQQAFTPEERAQLLQTSNHARNGLNNASEPKTK